MGRPTCRDVDTGRPTASPPAPIKTEAEGDRVMFKEVSGRVAGIALLGLAALTAPSLAEGIPGAPAPFDKGGVKVALVTYISAGDFFQAYQAGAEAQADALGIELQVFQGRQDAAEQRDQIQQAINLGVDGIIIDHGLPETLQDIAQAAVDAGIKVVAFDVNLDNPAIPQVEQSDHALAEAALAQAIKDNGNAFEAGYVYVAGFAPLDRRNETWEEVKKANPGIVEKARWGAVNDTTASSTADQTKAAFQANPDITVVFAPYDEFARGVKLATDELGISDKVKIYSADVSTADITEIAAEGSPWVATVATNPAVVGEVSVRAVAKLIAGEDPGHNIVVKPVLITQKDLRDNAIKTVEDLNAKLPAFGQSDAASASWIPAAAR
jgi:simple sugar transport system substrate-binding protein